MRFEFFSDAPLRGPRDGCRIVRAMAGSTRKTLLTIAGGLAGIAFGALFSSLFLSANWRGQTARVPLGLLAAIGVAVGLIATYRIRRHGLDFAEAVLLGGVFSIFASVALVVFVVTVV